MWARMPVLSNLPCRMTAWLSMPPGYKTTANGKPVFRLIARRVAA